ncbi:MAG: hypothetical protein H6832_10265 [Planctomycetes bacterium]|nr:hypothetical protein [Planctomycetota bacterium]MCB9918773.1 hypothetical protein [Planctomycetota bacterium]
MHARLLLACLFFPPCLTAQNPTPAVGSTRIDFVARSTKVDEVVVTGNTLEIEVDVQVEDDHHAYKCAVSVTIEVGNNEKTPRQIAQEACDAIEDQIGDFLEGKNLPRADAAKFLRCDGGTVIVKATPPTGNNTGTAEKPKQSYEGRLDGQIQYRMQTSKK